MLARARDTRNTTIPTQLVIQVAPNIKIKALDKGDRGKGGALFPRQ